ncbi:ACR3 family arsenite efflux transporter [Dankookia sp. P2]|uniref:ACR3 family arsenite efflux transporter n=1 Tax=Dankookia sp. P2 TaxID=3423955 RepID=UPI003D672C5B
MSVSAQAEAAIQSRKAAMGTFERYLTLWVALCIVAGIALGAVMPGFFHALGGLEVAQVNIPVAALIWLMIVPMLLRVDFAAMGQVAQHWRGIAVTLGVNWLVKPFSMALLGWLFIGWLFRPWLPAGQIDSYIAGLILLAAAPCTAMVFVWSRLTDGEPNFTLSQVALNDAIMVVAFAPVVGLLLGMSAITVPWDTLLLSVGLYIIVPLVAAQIWRRSLLASGGEVALQRTLKALNPMSLVALLTTLVLLFGFQGQQILAQPLVILLLAVPILIQVYFNAGLAYLLNRQCGSSHSVAGPSALIGASNFFELGGGCRHQPVRVRERRRAGHRGRRACGGAGDALGRPHRHADPRLVTTEGQAGWRLARPRMPGTQSRQVIVIGGGQSGLAVGYFLHRTGLDFEIFDANHGPGGAWPSAWDSLRLFSPAEWGSLPRWPMPPVPGGGYP